MNKIIYTGWLLLVILWIYGVPNALPYEDVFVAVCLSTIGTIITNYFEGEVK